MYSMKGKENGKTNGHNIEEITELKRLFLFENVVLFSSSTYSNYLN